MTVWVGLENRISNKAFTVKFGQFNILAGFNLGGFFVGGSNVLRLPIVIA